MNTQFILKLNAICIWNIANKCYLMLVLFVYMWGLVCEVLKFTGAQLWCWMLFDFEVAIVWHRSNHRKNIIISLYCHVSKKKLPQICKTCIPHVFHNYLVILWEPWLRKYPTNANALNPSSHDLAKQVHPKASLMV